MAVDLINLPRKMKEQMAIQEVASAGIQSLEHLIRLLNSSQSQNQNPHHLDSLSLPMVGELRGSALIFHASFCFLSELHSLSLFTSFIHLWWWVFRTQLLLLQSIKAGKGKSSFDLKCRFAFTLSLSFGALIFLCYFLVL
ncbi:hypothetical protein QN277_018117 [Acacia crassicarpa]|uniref:Uncharacterized protein n=1 Tax=Acacia crassicarpa TaxID=499986 RepID=A0AAE1JVR0_9FABA|nr:hypothetical protein QN277_018117 [Acacia crassicarpa]